MTNRGKWWSERADAKAWSTPDLSRLWIELPPSARTLLAAMATRPDGYPGADLDDNLDLAGYRGGILAAVTRRVEKLFSDRADLPYGWEQEPYRYTMHPDTAANITTLAGRTGKDTL